MKESVMDLSLVSCGLLLMTAYHLWLLHRIINYPSNTVVGLNAINRRFWVRAMMEDVSKNGVLAVQTLRNNIMASTLLASTAIMLSSLIAVLMTKNDAKMAIFKFDQGTRSNVSFSVKFFCILVCFLVAFLMNVQSIRYYSHASILINVPYQKMSSAVLTHRNLPAEYVSKTINRGSYFWSLGLRAFYFSFPLFLWIFGPIPMFVSCCVMVLMLYFLDVTFEFGWASHANSYIDIDNADVICKDDEELGNIAPCPIPSSASDLIDDQPRPK